MQFIQELPNACLSIGIRALKWSSWPVWKMNELGHAKVCMFFSFEQISESLIWFFMMIFWEILENTQFWLKIPLLTGIWVWQSYLHHLHDVYDTSRWDEH